MTRVNAVRTIRATLDRDNPGWREVLRREMTAKDPSWVAAGATVRTDDGELVEVTLLANPERVPDQSEIDPETDPFRE